ncbi:MAG: threonine synthase [Acidobacteria bacterium]|nr:threonine synthase [Acidobacteriota bacterium]
MKYVSTRGTAPVLPFDDVLLTGLARDGGLYLPESWPTITPSRLRAFADMRYAEVAVEVMWPFVEGAIDEGIFVELVEDAYRSFRHPDVVPLVELGGGVWLLELFHGPTLAFKDVALQLVGHLFEHELLKRGERVTIVGATSGDTGSAAIEACRDREPIDICILHPHERVSEVQRRQMTTVLSPNVHNLAVEGTFDDCQDLVKAMFNDLPFRDRFHLSAVNSINWARILAQTVYYVKAAAQLGGPVAFSVPTGNFGNIFAGWAARQMGVPIRRLVIGSNRNDILPRFFESGVMAMHGVTPTSSPSMDIQVSSNFERLLFELCGRNGAVVTHLMTRFRADGTVDMGESRLGMAREIFDAARIDDDAVLRVIAATYERTGRIVDPHTAVGLGAAGLLHHDPATPIVSLATAHPAKFPDAVEEAIGIRPELPDFLGDLFERPERYEVVANDLAAVEAHVASSSRMEG